MHDAFHVHLDRCWSQREITRKRLIDERCDYRLNGPFSVSGHQTWEKEEPHQRCMHQQCDARCDYPFGPRRPLGRSPNDVVG